MVHWSIFKDLNQQIPAGLDIWTPLTAGDGAPEKTPKTTSIYSVQQDSSQPLRSSPTCMPQGKRAWEQGLICVYENLLIQYRLVVYGRFLWSTIRWLQVGSQSHSFLVAARFDERWSLAQPVGVKIGKGFMLSCFPFLVIVPSGKRLHNWWEGNQFLMGQLTMNDHFQLAMLNYVELPEGSRG